MTKTGRKLSNNGGVDAATEQMKAKLYAEPFIEKERSDEDFMALFEQFPQFDEFDDSFVENEEEWTAMIAHYVDEHLDNFVHVVE